MKSEQTIAKKIEWLTYPSLSPDSRLRVSAIDQQNNLTKPQGSLGRLEQVAIQLASLSKSDKPCIDRVSIIIFAADHGIASESVSLFPQSVTVEMIKNFVTGGAAISVLAKELDAGLDIVNVGTITATDHLQQVYNDRVASGTTSFYRDQAMTQDQLSKALTVGRNHILRIEDAGCDLFIGGEMGIGNTTASTAILCKLFALEAKKFCGPGTGLSQAGIEHKANIIDQSLQFHRDLNNDPISVLAGFGGFEIAALTGAYLTCGQVGIAVLVDGYISSIAALLAVKLNPDLEKWLIYAHESYEPAHQFVLKQLQAAPLLKLEMRLGEASGAAMALPLLKLACALHNKMATFEQAAVSTAKCAE